MTWLHCPKLGLTVTEIHGFDTEYDGERVVWARAEGHGITLQDTRFMLSDLVVIP